MSMSFSMSTPTTDRDDLTTFLNEAADCAVDTSLGEGAELPAEGGAEFGMVVVGLASGRTWLGFIASHVREDVVMVERLRRDTSCESGWRFFQYPSHVRVDAIEHIGYTDTTAYSNGEY